jgi:hypothetical protein
MIRSRLFWKLYLGYVGLVLFTAIVIGTLAWRRIELDILEESRNRLAESASLLREIGRTAAGNGSEQTLASLRAAVKRIGDRSCDPCSRRAPRRRHGQCNSSHRLDHSSG